MSAPFLHHIHDHQTLTSQPRDPHSSPDRMRKTQMTSPPTTIPMNTDGFTIEELSESDQLGYASDIEIIYPDELEEAGSTTSDTIDDQSHQDTEEELDNQDSDTATISRQIRRLRCNHDKAATTPSSSSSSSSPTRRQQTPITTTPARKRLHDETFPPLESGYAESLHNTSDDQEDSQTSARKTRRLRAPLKAAISSPAPVSHPPFTTAPTTTTTTMAPLGEDSMDIDSCGSTSASLTA